jgi:hypothetical protein
VGPAGPLGDHRLGGDRGAGVVLGDESEDLALAIGQPRRGALERALGQRTRQPARDDRVGLQPGAVCRRMALVISSASSSLRTNPDAPAGRAALRRLRSGNR